MKTLSVIVEQCLAPVPGGTGRYAAQIWQALAATAPQGWQVRGVTAWHRDLTPASSDRLPRPVRMPAGHRVLTQLWQRGLPPSPRGASIHATTPLAPRRRQPQVITVHDTVPWTHPQTLTPRGVAWHREAIGRAASAADALVVPTAVVATELSTLFPAAAERIHVIGHGVTILPEPTDPAADAARLALPDRFVLSLSTLEPRKGLDVLLTAMARLHSHGPVAARVPLVVVGQGGWGDVDLPSAAAKAGLPDHELKILGRISDADLSLVLSRATVLAVPSRAEGFGLPVLEGFSAGVPVVSSDAPALVEVAGDAALLFPRDDASALADSLITILTDEDLAAAHVVLGRRRAADFSWTTAATALWHLHTSFS